MGTEPSRPFPKEIPHGGWSELKATCRRRAFHLDRIRGSDDGDSRQPGCALGAGGDPQQRSGRGRRSRRADLRPHHLGLGSADPRRSGRTYGPRPACGQCSGSRPGNLPLGDKRRPADRLVPRSAAVGVPDDHSRRRDHLPAHGQLD